MQKVNLTSIVSKVNVEWGAALKVSEIIGRLFSFLLQEGKTKDIFELRMDLNLSELETGYYAVIGSDVERLWPQKLFLDNKGFYDDSARLPELCYALIKIQAIPRRGEEIARGEPWWELLQTGKEQALLSTPKNKKQRQDEMNEWRSSLVQVRKLARNQTACLLNEIDEIIVSAHDQVQEHILPKLQTESYQTHEYSEDWQQLLKVSNYSELKNLLKEYHISLEITDQLLANE